MRPFETYPGGKGADGTYQTIINHIPPHNVFISGFLGNCAIMRYKKPAAVNVGIDVDPSVITAWQTQNNSKLAPHGSVFNAAVQLDLFNCSFFEYAEKFLDAWNYDDVVIYLDPPYLKDTRKDAKRDLYRFEMTVSDHRKLMGLVLSMRANIVISCYDNELYSNYLDKWCKVDFTGKTRHGSVTETIYMNYKLEGKLHDYRYVGNDFTDRQRIKRKVQRHVDKLKRLPEAERNAILNELAQSFSL